MNFADAPIRSDGVPTGADFFLATNPTEEQIREAIKSTQAHGDKLIAELNRRIGFTTHSVMSLDPGCICFGNWRTIVKEHELLFDRAYKQVSGPKEEIWYLTGVVWASDDLYYMMYSEGKTHLLTCVGSIETQGFELVPRPEGCVCTEKCEGDCSGYPADRGGCGCKQCRVAHLRRHGWTDEILREHGVLDAEA